MRTLIRRHCKCATLIVALAMLARLLIPVGYMPMAGQSTMALTICTGMGAQTIDVPIGADRNDQQHGMTADLHPCAFAGAGLIATGMADAPLLAGALLFAFIAALAPVATARLIPAGFLRPPLRAPPLPA